MKQNIFVLALTLLLAPFIGYLYASSPEIHVYLDCGLAHNGRSYLVSENVDLLKKFYGADWESSVAWRTYKILRTNDEKRRELQELINIRGLDVHVHIKVDDIGVIVNIPDIGGRTITIEDGNIEKTVLRAAFENKALRSLTSGERVRYKRLLEASKADLRAQKVLVWPHCYATRRLVNLPHRFAGRRGLESLSYEKDKNNDELRGLLFHEIAHSQDLSVRERTSYGLDNKHYVDELLTVRAAFKEGWANYYEAIGNPSYTKKTIFRNIRQFRIERKKRSTVETLRSQSEYVDFEYPLSQTPVLCSEMVNAAIFIAMDAGGKNRKKMIAAFAKTNQRYRHVNHLIKAYLDDNPQDALRVLRIIDFISGFEAECSFQMNFGDEHAREYLYGTPYPQRKKKWGDQQAFLKELWVLYLRLEGESQASKKEQGALMWQFILDYRYLDFKKMDEELSSPKMESDVQLLSVTS